MPLYLDVHTIEDGVALEDVAKAHRADLAIEKTPNTMCATCVIGSTKPRARSSASSRRPPRGPRRPCTAKRTDSLPITSSRSGRGPNPDTQDTHRAAKCPRRARTGTRGPEVHAGQRSGSTPRHRGAAIRPASPLRRTDDRSAHRPSHKSDTPVQRFCHARHTLRRSPDHVPRNAHRRPRPSPPSRPA